MYRTVRDAWIMRRQKFDKTPFGFMFMGPDYMQTGHFETDEVAVIRHYLNKIDLFIDIGANTGYYTCLARSSNKHTIAIEPLNTNLYYLYANLEANGWGDVEVFPMGLSYNPGTSTLWGSGTGASLIKNWAGASPLLKRTISLTTLDNLFEERFPEKNLFIKVDVEGCEFDVLQGARKTLAKVPTPIWMVEIGLKEHHPQGLNPNYARTFEIFWKHGYRAYTATSDQKPVLKSDVEQWMKMQHSDSGTANYLFIK